MRPTFGALRHFKRALGIENCLPLNPTTRRRVFRTCTLHTSTAAMKLVRRALFCLQEGWKRSCQTAKYQNMACPPWSRSLSTDYSSLSPNEGMKPGFLRVSPTETLVKGTKKGRGAGNETRIPASEPNRSSGKWHQKGPFLRANFTKLA